MCTNCRGQHEEGELLVVGPAFIAIHLHYGMASCVVVPNGCHLRSDRGAHCVTIVEPRDVPEGEYGTKNLLKLWRDNQK